MRTSQRSFNAQILMKNGQVIQPLVPQQKIFSRQPLQQSQSYPQQRQPYNQYKQYAHSSQLMVNKNEQHKSAPLIQQYNPKSQDDQNVQQPGMYPQINELNSNNIGKIT
eukprot:UN05263